MGRVATTILVAFAVLTSQTAPQVFRTTADMVPVYATVTGRDGIPIANLQQADFTILEDGRRQPIAFFSAARRQVAVALVIDTSMSMLFGAGLARQVTAARALAEALDPDDQIALGSLTRLLVELSADKISVSRLLQQPPTDIAADFRSPGGEAASQRGLSWALLALRGYAGRRLVIMFTDGQSRPSGLDFDQPLFTFQDPAQAAEQLVTQADRADTSIHAITFDDTMVDELFLAAFAGTGGGAALIARDANLTAVMRELAEELHHEYLLGFVPAHADGKSHRIQVQVTIQGARVRARQSYFAERKPQVAPQGL